MFLFCKSPLQLRQAHGKCKRSMKLRRTGDWELSEENKLVGSTALHQVVKLKHLKLANQERSLLENNSLGISLFLPLQHLIFTTAQLCSKQRNFRKILLEALATIHMQSLSDESYCSERGWHGSTENDPYPLLFEGDITVGWGKELAFI